MAQKNSFGALAALVLAARSDPGITSGGQDSGGDAGGGSIAAPDAGSMDPGTGTDDIPPEISGEEMDLLRTLRYDDGPAAYDLFVRGCAAYNPYSCYNQGVYLESGRGGVARDEQAGVGLMKQACRRGARVAGCADL